MTIERPLYSNAFSVTYNHQVGEVILNFDIEYPRIIALNADETVNAQVEQKRESVCSLVMPKATAAQLIDIMKQSLAGEHRNE